MLSSFKRALNFVLSGSYIIGESFRFLSCLVFFVRQAYFKIILNSRVPLLLRCFSLSGVSTDSLKCSLYFSWVEYQSAWAAIAKYHRLGSQVTEICFLTVLATGSPRSRSQQGWCLVRSLPLGCRWLHSHCVLT